MFKSFSLMLFLTTLSARMSSIPVLYCYQFPKPFVCMIFARFDFVTDDPRFSLVARKMRPTKRDLFRKLRWFALQKMALAPKSREKM